MVGRAAALTALALLAAWAGTGGDWLPAILVALTAVTISLSLSYAPH